MSKAAQLRMRLQRPDVLVVPGAVDALGARVIESCGYEALYATGAGISNAQFALPDMGLVSAADVVQQVRRIGDATTIPLIADIDAGFGNPLNVIRTVQEFESAGAAAVQIEDQVMPKRCGHFSGKSVVSVEEMVQKIRAACAARTDANLVIIARTDAIATEGFEASMSRARRYAEAGADVLFVEAPRTVEQMAAIPSALPIPTLINLVEGGLTPILSHQQLASMGYRIILHANLGMRVAVKAMLGALQRLRSDGGSLGLLPDMITTDQRNELTRFAAMRALEDRYVHSAPVSESPDSGSHRSDFTERKG